MKLAKENDVSCVDTVGYGMVPLFSEAAMAKLAKEIAESRVHAVFGMTPLLSEAS